MLKQSPKHILILNLHSALNLGDDAIMHATLRDLRAAFPGVQITAAANDPNPWRKHPGLEVVPSLCSWVGDCRLGRYRQQIYKLPLVILLLFFAAMTYRYFKKRLEFGGLDKRCLLQAYYDADLVLSCGGGNFYAHRSLSPALIMNLLAVAFATWLGKRTILLPQSVGPIDGRIQRRLAGSVLNRVSRIWVREPRSLSFLKDHLKVNTLATILPDLAFSLPSLPPAGVSTSTRPLQVGVTIIDRGAQKGSFRQQSSYERALREALLLIQKETGAQLHIFVQCHGPSPDQDDRSVANRLYQGLLQHTGQVSLHDDFQDSLEIRTAYHDMDCVIGSRMHTAIFAFGASTPVLLFGYQPKAFGMMELFGMQRYCFDIEHFDPEQFVSLVRDAIHNRARLQRYISNQYAHTRSQLQGWTGYLSE